MERGARAPDTGYCDPSGRDIAKMGNTDAQQRKLAPATVGRPHQAVASRDAAVHASAVMRARTAPIQAAY